MYETEAHLKTESSSQIPPEVLTAFGELRGKILSRSLISWGEHCTECGWPTCYSTCELYVPREDLKCRRFVEGMVRVDYPASLNGYLLKIRFKRWGMLWARGNFRLQSTSRAERLEQRDYRIGTALQRLPLSAPLRRKATNKRYALKKRLASRGAAGDQKPTSFMLECYNPRPETVRLSLRIASLHSNHPFPNLIQIMPGFRRERELTPSEISFQKLVEVAPGFHRESIPFEEMDGTLDLRLPFAIDITPNNVEESLTLYFGMMDFVQEEKAKPGRVKTIKCVVWDLDNTLWDGILVEDGLEKLRLKPGIAEVIQELDRRGILHSIASKNNEEEALQALRRFGLEEYLLYPQISWQPKSESIKAIARSLNIGVDSLLFVDDSDFELHEVQAGCEGIKVLNAGLYGTLPEREDCRVPVTAESASRRKMYQVETARRAVAQSFGQDYLAFLRHCNIKLEIKPLMEENLERVYELTQRTNQMNFSGNRYDRKVLRGILATSHLDTYVMACEDRFGSYGVVGFSIVDRQEPRMTDLMFSCRIQSKRVEHAFLAFIIRKYLAELNRDFLANYRKTPRNAPSGQVFTDVGMEKVSESEDGVSVWVFPKDKTPLEDGIVAINISGAAVCPA